MVKKFIGVLVIALACVALASASTANITCNPNSLTASFSGSPNPTIATTTVNCDAFTIPFGFTLNSVTLSIDNTFSGGVNGQSNAVQFTYSFTNFSNLVGLTTSVASFPGSGHNGISVDQGGITGVNPGGFSCSPGVAGDIFTCNEGVGLSNNAFSFTVTSAWLSGGLNSGSDSVSISAFFTYSPTISTPEPASLMMIGGGLVGLALVARRKRKA